MREALKTNISKYGPKTNAAMTVENVQGKGLQLVVIYAGRKHYLPLSSVPMNADTHANHPNHQKIKVENNGDVYFPSDVGIGDSTPNAKLHIDQADSSGNKPSMIIDQADTSEEFIVFNGTSSTGVDQPLTTWTSGNSIQGFIRIKIGISGTVRWLPFYDNPSS